MPIIGRRVAGEKRQAKSAHDAALLNGARIKRRLNFHGCEFAILRTSEMKFL
jgi:hypothetical protein